jgi:phage-related protein
MEVKPLKWVGTTRKRLREFPELARNLPGKQLWRLQIGRPPDDWKPMGSVGLGAKEIRIHQPHEHRVIYLANFPEAIYVIHAFEKKTQQTSQLDIQLARTNYVRLRKERNSLQRDH